jgi:hypothetical protein
MVFAAYFITWLNAFPNSLNYLEVGPSPESEEFTRELQKFPDWENDVPSYGVTVLVIFFNNFLNVKFLGLNEIIV